MEDRILEKKMEEERRRKKKEKKKMKERCNRKIRDEKFDRRRKIEHIFMCGWRKTVESTIL